MESLVNTSCCPVTWRSFLDSADETSRLWVEGVDVEDPWVSEVLWWEPAAGEPARRVGSSGAGAWKPLMVRGLTFGSESQKLRSGDSSRPGISTILPLGLK